MSDKPPDEYYYGTSKKSLPKPIIQEVTETPLSAKYRLVHQPVGRVQHGPLGFQGDVQGYSYLSTQPYVSFRGQFLAIPRVHAHLVSIYDIKVGYMRHNIGGNPIPGDVFIVEDLATLRETAFAEYSRWDIGTCHVSQTIQISLNAKEAITDFQCALFGIYHSP